MLLSNLCVAGFFCTSCFD